MELIEVGFTGTQRGMTYKQKTNLANFLYRIAALSVGYFHHGDCIGADAEASDIASLYGYPIYLHPPIITQKRAYKFFQESAEPKSYIKRNHDIVDSCQIIIAAPATTQEQLRSGTWATIRYARKVGKLLYILEP